MLSYQVIGKHLKNARVRKKLSQSDVANRADISLAYYGKIERGDIRPNLDRLADVCEVLSIPICEIFKGARIESSELTNCKPSDDEFISFLHDLSSCTDHERKQLIMQVCKVIAEYGRI